MTELIPKIVVNNQTLDSIKDFCTRGLLIPDHLIAGYSMEPNLDAFTVHTMNDLKFTISGPELAQWEFRRQIKRPCVPERD